MVEKQGAPEKAAAQSLAAEVASAVRKDAVGYVAKAVIATAVGIISAAGLGLWLYVKTVLPDIVGGVPRGAVLAFDRDDLGEDRCPPGWDPFVEARGRAIVGAGDPAKAPGKMAADENGRPLKGYVLRQHGGEQEHVLTVREMPSHHHKLLSASQWDTGAEPTPDNTIKQSAWPGADPSYILKNQDKAATLAKSSDVGEGAAHNNMPPFVALFFCKKKGD